MLGYDSKEEILNPSCPLFPEFQPDGSFSLDKAQEMMRLAKERGNYRYEWVCLHKDGSFLPVEISLTAVHNTHSM